MSENNMKYTEIPSGIIDSLRHDYNHRKVKAVDDCPVSESSIAYAFEELNAAERQTIEAHLQTCRSCMNLVLDAREAGIEAKEAADHPVKILPELSDAIVRSENPTFLEKLAAGFRMPSIAPKIIAAVAVACIVVPVTYTALKDPATNKNLPIVTKNIPAEKNKKSEPAEPPADDAQPVPSSINSITVHDRQATDPFEPIFNAKDRHTVSRKKRSKRMPLTPLEALDLSQLKLVGVMLSERGNTALVEDASGKGYVIKEGTYIGTNAGKVTQILKDRFIVEEELEGIDGKRVVQIREIILHKP